jgi:hypothetical protein
MFFINAQELGSDFFAPQAMGERLRVPLGAALAHPEKINDKRARQFLGWVVDVALPIVLLADSTRIPDEAESALCVKPNYNHGPAHTDSTVPHNRTFITLGVNEDGTTGSTTTPRELNNYYGPPTSSYGKDALRKHFYIPPFMHASVFDPDVEMHASVPGINRTLYKVEIEPAYRHENLKYLTAPAHPLALDITRLETV